jgi:hypothetical protein
MAGKDLLPSLGGLKVVAAAMEDDLIVVSAA